MDRNSTDISGPTLASCMIVLIARVTRRQHEFRCPLSPPPPPPPPSPPCPLLLPQNMTLSRLVFASPPTLDAAGRLSLAPASGSTGRAVFRLNQLKPITGGSATSSGLSQMLVVRVIAVNRPPTFRLASSDFFTTESDGTIVQVIEWRSDRQGISRGSARSNCVAHTKYTASMDYLPLFSSLSAACMQLLILVPWTCQDMLCKLRPVWTDMGYSLSD
jgi:hypothetical protein